MNDSIPRQIFQTFPTATLPPELELNVRRLQSLNPSWDYRLYDDSGIEKFILWQYDSRILDAYQRIAPEYGAARADLFRYLLMYKFGGVYLDIKSACEKPFDEVLTLDEGCILSHWSNSPKPGEFAPGEHPELSAFPAGELQQWYIITAPGHPFLKAVIGRVLKGLNDYRPWNEGVGRTGVLRTTGPIPYTLAIEPLKSLHRHKDVGFHDAIGLSYNAARVADHRTLFRKHYTQQDTAIVRPTWSLALPYAAYLSTRRLKHRLFRRGEVR